MNRSDSADRPADRAALPWAASLAVAFMAAAAASPVLAQTPGGLPSAEQGSVVLEADTLVKDDQSNTITAEGNVEARYRGRTLRTNRLIYDLEKRTIRAQGDVQILDPDGTVRFADELEVDEELNTGVAAEFAMRIPGGGTIAAATALRPDENHNELVRVVYTACPICTVDKDGDKHGPTWTLRARRAVQNQNTDMISYRDVVIRIGDVPVVYLPYLTHPDPSAGPRSGLLLPDAGKNNRLGYFYEQPIHWAISPYQDLTLTPRLHEKVNPLLGFEYRKRFYSGDMRFAGSVTQEQFFGVDDRTGVFSTSGENSLRGHVFGDGQFVIDDFWSWGFGIERTTDDTYLRRYSIDFDERANAQFLTDRQRLFSQLYVTAQDEQTYGSISAVAFQGLRESDDATLLPVLLPIGEVERVVRDPLLDGQLRLQASTATLWRGEDDKTDSARISVGGEWRRDRVVGPGVVVGPFAAARADLYRVEQPTCTQTNSAGQCIATNRTDDSFTRSVGVVGAEVRWPFMRPGDRVDAVVEPIAMVAIGTSENDDRIVNEDSLAFELDDSNLFRPNAAPNFDVWEPGARASVGVRATALTRGNKSASVFFGRRWREEQAIVNGEPLFSRLSNLDRDGGSDYVSAITAEAGRNFGANVRMRLDEEDFSLQRIDAALRGSLWRLSANARYFRVSEEIRLNQAGGEQLPSEEVWANASARLTDRWRLGYSTRIDLDSAKTLSQNARLFYQDACTFFEFGYVREDFRGRVGPSEGFQFRIGFSTLGGRVESLEGN